MSGIATRSLNRITFDANGGATPAERWEPGHRIREVEVAPDGALWLLEDANPGGVFRLKLGDGLQAVPRGRVGELIHIRGSMRIEGESSQRP